ncbi:hypothetical protein Rhe02_42510 [Rhizocola hellebori]|uniref:Condensation domain-containing protein n=1 Tax=Rhizocola hellebori TaxID=1392758 RepID=A0A8J3QA11_9ACTN|nr:condensation domain-containing protein [Rhizocola hellebori]GIH06184.1 hypothetical protein Rhe02_42510 [Rhizocola hellebori]
MKPLSALQRRMWHLCTSYSGTSSPIVVTARRFRGPLDVARFTSAVAQVVDRHDSLRTVFAVHGDQPVQIVGPPGSFATELVETDDPQSVVEEQSTALLDLFAGPLVRSRLLRLAPDDHVWCFTVHHLLADGGSATIIENEVAALYSGESLPPVQPVTWDEDPQDLDWWVEQLTGAPVLWLPTDMPRPEHKGTRAVNHDEFLDLQLARDIEELARRSHSTPFMVLLTAFQLTLAQRSGQRDFCIGVPADGRDSVEAEQAVGLFANMLALRLRADQLSFAAQMRQTRSTFIEALSRQAVPFGQIVATLKLADAPNQTQVFQSIFCLHTEATPRDDLPGLAVEPFSAGHPQALHDLVLDLWRNEAGIVAAFRYDSCLFKPDTIADLARGYIDVLRAAAADPEGAL